MNHKIELEGYRQRTTMTLSDYPAGTFGTFPGAIHYGLCMRTDGKMFPAVRLMDGTLLAAHWAEYAFIPTDATHVHITLDKE